MIPEPLIKRLRSLNETVPIPMRLPTPEEVSAIEEELGIKFHPDLRQYLLELSDIVFGTLEPVTVTDSESHTYMQSVCEAAWDVYEMPKKLTPICKDNGDFYCLNKGGQVVFWSSDGETNEEWADLATWIEEVWIGENEQ
jgi:hypothetical protein